MENPKIRWCDIPEKGRYLAQDNTGYWYLYVVKPVYKLNRWCESYQYTQVAYTELVPNRDTLCIDLEEYAKSTSI